jgi:hypothetical protein
LADSYGTERNPLYKTLKELYSEISKTGIVHKGFEIERIVNQLLADIAKPFTQKIEVKYGTRRFDGEIFIGAGTTILYEVFGSNLSNFRYESLLSSVRATYFPYKTYLMIIARSFSQKDAAMIEYLTRQVVTEKVKVSFLSQETLIALHSFASDMEAKHTDKDSATLKRLFLIDLLETGGIIHEKSFSHAESFTLRRYEFEKQEFNVDYAALAGNERLSRLEQLLDSLLGEVHDIRDKLVQIDSRLSNVTPRIKVYKINLSKMEGKGAFPCPKCGNLIDPDESKRYKIIGTHLKKGALSELMIMCNKCKSKIRLTGFITATLSAKEQIRNRAKEYEKALIRGMK